MRHLPAAVLFAALAAGFWIHRVYSDPPGSQIAFGYQDVFWHALPTATFLHRELQRGTFPLWNPYQMAGQPFLALYVTAALYPPNLLFMGLLPPARALEALTLFHLTVAGLFTWLLGARLGLSPVARLAAALGYMLCSIQLQSIFMVPCLATQSWLPAILWALHGLLVEARWRWAVTLAVSFVLSFLGGYGSGTYYTLLLSFAYGLFGLAAVARGGTRLRVAALAAGSGILAVGFAAPQLLPTLELMAMSVRGLEALTYGQASLGAIPPRVLAAATAGWLPSDAEVMQRSAALPMLALPLALCGGLARHFRAQWAFFLGAAAVAGLYMLGAASPVFGFFYALPLGRSFRAPWQMLFVYQLLAAVLAGMGIDGIRTRLRGTRLRASVTISLTVLLAAGIYARTALKAPPPVIAPPHPGAPPELIAHLRATTDRERVFVQISGLGALQPKVGMINEIFALPDYESNMPSVYQRFLTGGTSSVWQGSLTFAPSRRGAAEVRPRLRALDLMSVRYYVIPPPVPPELSNALVPVGAGRGVRMLFHRREALPRAYVVGRVLGIDGFESALARVLDESFQPREEAVVSGDGALAPELTSTAPPGSGPVGGATILSYGVQRAEIAARCERPCLLVLTDLHYPGWRAEVDGQEVPIHRTNALFRGVHLPPGAHRVVFLYRPKSFRNGLLLLACALVLVVTGGFLARMRTTRSPIAS